MNRRLAFLPASFCTVVIGLFCCAPRTAAQTTPAPQATAPFAFDAASIREWGPGEGPVGAYVAGIEVFPDRISSRCASLNALLFFAFHLTRSSPVVGLPPWGNAACGAGFTNTFRIDATMPANTTQEQLRQMMQTLLADRFKLALHWEKKTLPVYALVVAPSGFRLKPSDPRNDPPRAPGSIGCPPNDRTCHIMVMGSAPISDFAGLLGGILGRPVIDQTGIAGTYYMDLKWASDVSPDSPLPSLPAALHEQFGLELKSERAPVDVLVIDHVEKPSPN